MLDTANADSGKQMIYYGISSSGPLPKLKFRSVSLILLTSDNLYFNISTLLIYKQKA